MLKIGAIILSIWGGFNALLATFILVQIIFFGSHPLISRVVFDEKEIAELTPKTVAAIKDLAILMNATALAISILVLFVVWTGLINKEVWAFWALLISVGLLQVMQFVGDTYIGNKTLPASIIMTILFLAGIILSEIGLFRK